MLKLRNVIKIKTIVDLITVLQEAPMTFHLTGSRFFGGATPISDYDFFGANTSDTKAFLTKHGFSQVIGSHYDFASGRVVNNNLATQSDHNVAEVWDIPDIEAHVQLVDDVELKDKIQETLKTYNMMPLITSVSMGDKEQMIRFWNLFYALANINSTQESKPDFDKAVEERALVLAEQMVEGRMTSLDDADLETKEEIALMT